MECGICNETIEEQDGFLYMVCTHHAHLTCFVRDNYLHLYHGNLARVHCSMCQEQSFSNDFITEINAQVDDNHSTENNEKLLEEAWKSKPQIKERLKKLQATKKTQALATKAFNALTKTTIDTLKKDTADTIHVLKGMYKSAYMKLTQSPEAKAVKSVNMSYSHLMDRLLDDFNTNQWSLRPFLRKKGYVLPYRYRYRHPSYKLRRKFSVKLI